ncbi:YHS domain-containing protein [Natrarchaeobius halalkaliphilus]|uniref:YHS domain-containing protein n=1 Tax=Natrarchaeobius halalkaliphilus TaxID=1679091 RepID=A0A3N6LU82_9EURY|nr:XdhC family protein [Natrarchaeobius halalkaliphilus]RQG91104.1 YHS domain-containing protein [Natrarchaeobius halalkaliphilus]
MTHDTTPHDESATDAAEGEREDGLESIEDRLVERREPYVRATVVRREPPVSANVGDRAVITADGELRGWIGGASCAQSIVTTEARSVLESGEPQLLGIAPDPERIDRDGLEAFQMTCHSEGVLEVFLESVNTAPDLLIVGDSPVARSLARLASELTFDVTMVSGGGDDGLDGDVPPGTTVRPSTDPDAIVDAIDREPIVVVASMGEFDARGIAAGIMTDALYIGLVASNTRAEEVIERAATVLETDPGAVREAVTNPAGVDVAAYTPAEIAASLLAEIVDVRATVGGATGNYTPADCGAGDGSADREPAIDPVCGMTVVRSDAPATVDHDDVRYYFCCPGCADAFRSDPESYLETTETRVSTP